MSLISKADEPMDGNYKDMTHELKKSKRNRSKMRLNEL